MPLISRRQRLQPAALVFCLLMSCVLPAHAGATAPAPQPQPSPEPLVIGETFVLRSERLGENRRVNVYLPAAYRESSAGRLPVLYMPDGGLAEDFLHIAGLVHVLAGNGGMRPFILVGIENTERRRDLTGPTDDPEDRAIAPRVGGSAAFRAFIRDELIPAVDARYRTSTERAIVGESLAGLFVIETFALEPTLFEHYIAVDPSVWWNRNALIDSAPRWLDSAAGHGARSLFVATGREGSAAPGMQRLLATLNSDAHGKLDLHTIVLPDETHATIFHPAALHAFRTVFAPQPVQTPAP